MTLDEARASIGLLVVYRRSWCDPEQGVITSVNNRYVFVRYGAQVGSQATDPADLERIALTAHPPGEDCMEWAGVDDAPDGPDKVWACVECGRTHRQGDVS